MKVLLTKSFQTGDLEYMKVHLNDSITLIRPDEYTEQSLLNHVQEAEVFLGSYFTEKMLMAAKKLKFIQVPWTGVDNLDFDMLIKHNLTICNSHSNANVVAEHAVALMLDAAKKISYHDRLLRLGEWNRVTSNKSNSVSPFSSLISRSKVGIIGYGSIGKRIASIIAGYECKIKAFTRDIINEEEYKENIEIFSPAEIQSEIHDLNYVFIAVPLTIDTRKMIDKGFLSSMHQESILINISRGEVLHEEDLFNALESKSIAFAAIDTWFNYPSKNIPVAFPSTNFSYHLLDNIVLSPHRAGYVKGGFPHLDDAVENINRFTEGKPLINIVSLTDKY